MLGDKRRTRGETDRRTVAPTRGRGSRSGPALQPSFCPCQGRSMTRPSQCQERTGEYDETRTADRSFFDRGEDASEVRLGIIKHCTARDKGRLVSDRSARPTNNGKERTRLDLRGSNTELAGSGSHRKLAVRR